MSSAKFIVFEGIDGSGKSTVSKLLFEKMSSELGNVYHTAEPTNGPVGSLIRNILNKRVIADEKTIGALFLADRIDHIQNPITGISNYLKKGTHVISDRYYYSSYAYHVPAMSLDWLINANKICADLLRPDIVFFLDVSVDESLKRLGQSRHFQDLFETREKIEQVAQNYKEAIKKEGKKDNVYIIDGTQTPDEIMKDVWAKTLEIINK